MRPLAWYTISTYAVQTSSGGLGLLAHPLACRAGQSAAAICRHGDARWRRSNFLTRLGKKLRELSERESASMMQYSAQPNSRAALSWLARRAFSRKNGSVHSAHLNSSH